MTSSSLLILTLGSAVFGQTPQKLPDELDLLRSINRTPQVALLLDHSCSMKNGAMPTSCVNYAAAYNGGYANLTLNKNEMMKAALVGCTSDTDGVLDKWVEMVNFSVMQFPTRGLQYGVRAPFGSDLATLEAAVLGVEAKGGTPITEGLLNASKYFDAYFNDSNTKSCRPNYVVLLSDGNPNGNDETFSGACNSAVPPRTVEEDEPWFGADYMANNGDQLCSLAGEQAIQSYSIGFGASGSFNESNLQNIANYGGGAYYYASDVAALDDAFSSIIQDIVDRSAVFFSAPAVQRSGLFSGNYMYVSAYRPEAMGLWRGNVKKLCIFPRKLPNSTEFDTSDNDCVFRWNAVEEKFFTNPLALDQWDLSATGTTTADIGGAGRVMLDSLGEADGVPDAPVRPRNILTWRDDDKKYVSLAIDGSDPWTDEDAWISAGARADLINYLHGYTFDADEAGDPIKVREWPIGDFVHSPTALLRFGDCELPGKCWVITSANDGMIHFFDAANGIETTALIPAQMWRPNGVAKNPLAEVKNQPTANLNHRYYVDGGMRLYHVDQNRNGIIESTEKASLIIGLGRGGRGYYSLSVNKLAESEGRLNAAKTPIRSLLWTENSEYEEIQETWASPWIGQMKDGNEIKNVAVFASGHISSHDDPDNRLPSKAPKMSEFDDSATSITCAAAAAQSGLQPFCSFNVPPGLVLDFTTGTFNLPNAIAYRAKFSQFNLHPADRVYIQDGQGRAAAVLSGTGQAAAPWSQGLDAQGWSPWVYASDLQVRIVTTGQFSLGNNLTLASLEYIRAPTTPSEHHKPTVFVIDLEKWNEDSNDFQRKLGAGAVQARFTRDCNAGANCFDRSNSRRADLKHMTCAISAEVSVYTVAGKLSSLYWPDECGQIFKAWHDGTDWNVKRLLYVNKTPNMQAMNQGRSKDFRKFFQRLDLVPSVCPGKKVTGVYFGTGNLQRPSATDELTKQPANNTPAGDRDVVGVLWDDGSIANLDLSALKDVTGIEELKENDLVSTIQDPKYGWFWQLEKDEKALRRPLVFQGAAYWKTYQPTIAAAECENASGRDRIYAVNNCSAKALVDNPSTNSIEDREVWSASTDIGGDLLVLSPENGPPLVTHANLAASQAASLVPAKSTRKIPFIYHWRIPRED